MFRAFPDNTADALYSGAMQAICGAIEQMRRQIDTDAAKVRVYLGGGAAPEILPHLNPPVEVAEYLVLEGVLALAGVAEAG
jgi:type III pantothenate kinase